MTANELLQTIKNALEEYLTDSGMIDLPVYNCSARGAAIAGTRRRLFPEWLQRFTASHASPVFTFSGQESFPAAWLREKELEFRHYADKVTAIAEAAEAHDSPDHADTVRTLRKAEKTIPASLCYMIGNLRRQVDALMLSRSLPIRRDTATLEDDRHNLALRYRFHGYLNDDFVDKLAAAAVLNSDDEKNFTAAIYEHRAFAHIAGIVAGRSHPVLGEYLAAPGPATPHPAFRFTYKWHDIESVIRHDCGAGETILEPARSYSSAITRQMPGILKELRLDSHDGIVFLAPCGWQYVFALLQLLPECPLLILEPFPQLLRRLVRYSRFPSDLPESAALIGFEPALFPDDETILGEHLTRWQQKGIRPRLLVHPRAADIPEIAPARVRLESLLK